MIKKFPLNQLLDINIHHENKLVQHLFSLGKLICASRRETIESTDYCVINHIHKYIKDNLQEDLTLTKIANQVYLNPSYLSRFYKQYTGKKLSDYMNELKIIKAKQLLKDNKLKINEIGFQLGFKSPSYFTSFFKKMTTLTPNEYRVSLKKIH